MNVERRSDFVNCQSPVIVRQNYEQSFLPNDLCLRIFKSCNLENLLSGNLDVVSYQFYRLMKHLRGELNPYFKKLSHHVSQHIMKTNIFNGRVIFSNTIDYDDENFSPTEDAPRIDYYNFDVSKLYKANLSKLFTSSLSSLIRITHGEKKTDKITCFSLIGRAAPNQQEHDIVLKYESVSLEACSLLKYELHKIGVEVAHRLNILLNAS
jgi:hypothetical protein